MLEIKPCFLTSGLREAGQEADSRGPERILGEKNIVKCKDFPNTPEAQRPNCCHKGRTSPS